MENKRQFEKSKEPGGAFMMIPKTETQKIHAIVDDVFTELQADVKRRYNLKDDYNIDDMKKQIVDGLSSMIVSRTNALLDTLRNLLFDDAVNHLKKAPIDIRNNFYKQGFKEMIEKSFQFKPDNLIYSHDPRIVNSCVIGGSALLAGGLIAFFIFSGLWPKVIAGIITLALSGTAAGITYKKMLPKARVQFEKDIESFLSTTKKQLIEEFHRLTNKFFKEFEIFCKNEGFGG